MKAADYERKYLLTKTQLYKEQLKAKVINNQKVSNAI